MKCPVPCSTCKKPVLEEEWRDYRCVFCDLQLCRRCDDTSDILKWTEVREHDYYLCGDCIARGYFKKSEPVRVEEKPATADNVYTRTPTSPSS